MGLFVKVSVGQSEGHSSVLPWGCPMVGLIQRGSNTNRTFLGPMVWGNVLEEAHGPLEKDHCTVHWTGIKGGRPFQSASPFGRQGRAPWLVSIRSQARLSEQGGVDGEAARVWERLRFVV